MIEDYIRYRTERLELINNIKLSSDKLDFKFLEEKTISELMRIYYAGFENHCVRCGEEVHIRALNTIYRNNAS